VITIGGGAHDQIVEHVTGEICSFIRARNAPGMSNDEIRTPTPIAALEEALALLQELQPATSNDPETLGLQKLFVF
jgi:hypothetical protein